MPLTPHGRRSSVRRPCSASMSPPRTGELQRLRPSSKSNRAVKAPDAPVTLRDLVDEAVARLREEATAAAVSLGFTADANLREAVMDEIEWWGQVHDSQVGSPCDAE